MPTPTVSELTHEIKELLEGTFCGVQVSGEVSQPTTSSNGHLYFTLKDAQAQIACVVWRSTVQRVDLAHGQQLIVSGDVQVYPPHGKYQLIVQSVEQAGTGALQEAFEKLKKKLEAEGLFDSSAKKPLPVFPKTIGVVTSETGAAFQDIRSTLEKRYPLVRLLLYPAAVQGTAAASEIARGIRYFATSGLADVLIVGRGGGSLEDLWPFNEEAVARAIHACPVPVISAVGHETDFSISDFVADVRAATPTQAATLATPDIRDLRFTIDDRATRMLVVLRERVSRQKETVNRLIASQGYQTLRNRIALNRSLVNGYMQTIQGTLNQRTVRAREQRSTLMFTLQQITGRKIGQHKEKLGTLQRKLAALDPAEPMRRGFTRIMQDGRWIRSSERFTAEQPFTIEWKDGTIPVNKPAS